MFTRGTMLVLASLALVSLPACSDVDPNEAQARALFDQWHGESPPLRLEGPSVHVEFDVELAQGEDADIERSAAFFPAVDCIIEATGYPGRDSFALVAGEEWNGWTYEEAELAVRGFSAVFTSIDEGSLHAG